LETDDGSDDIHNPSCGYCKVAKEFFRASHVAFTEYNVASDQRKADEMVRKSGQMGVP